MSHGYTNRGHQSWKLAVLIVAVAIHLHLLNGTFLDTTANHICFCVGLWKISMYLGIPWRESPKWTFCFCRLIGGGRQKNGGGQLTPMALSFHAATFHKLRNFVLAKGIIIDTNVVHLAGVEI